MEESAVGKLTKHLGCTLRVSNIGQFGMARGLQSELNLLCCIILSILIKTVVKEFFGIAPSIVLDVPAPVNVASVVACPDVVALISQCDSE